MLFSFAMAENMENMIWLTMGLWLLVLTAVSSRNLWYLLKNEKKNLLPLELLDRTYPDLLLCVLAVGTFWNQKLLWRSYRRAVRAEMAFFGVPEYFFSFLMLFFVTGTVVLFVEVLCLSVVRHAVREKLRKKLFFLRIKNGLGKRIYKVQKAWQRYQEACLRKENASKFMMKKYLTCFLAQVLVIFLTILYGWGAYLDVGDIMPFLLGVGGVLCLLDVALIVRISKEIGMLMDEIAYIAEDQDGDLTPVLRKNSLFRKSEEELLAIREHKKESVEKQLQSERMKVELITNVSHDLKTPLTSMIGCIDLLKQVEELPKEAQDYVNLLSRKAAKLREMIQDVFDMAKAASGGQGFVMEKLDMARLIRQTMADMQDRIEASGLLFRVKIEEGELLFLGDSKKMYRVYQNLLENTLKYSMAKSRVYVTVEEENGWIRTSVKNTSACEMEFTAEEIEERFTRGDKSRSTEGNGLGIAIAKSFSEACKGKFVVTVDGDLFKVETEFRKC